MANDHKRVNFIGKLNVNGVLVDDKDVFSKVIVDFYEDLFYEEKETFC